MSTQKRKSEAEVNDIKKLKTESTSSVQSESIEIKKMDIESLSTNCKDCNVEECVTIKNDEKSREYYFSIIGEHENQVAEGGEESLPKYMKYCKKNPGHHGFIPIESFSVKHIHEINYDNDLFELIKAVADLTVKISVKITSPERPEFWPKSNRPYHLADLRGKKTLRTGSGWVCNVIKHTDEEDNDDKDKADDNKDNDEVDDIDEDDTETMYPDYQTCPCDKCKASDKPKKVWWEIHVDTAAHVVVDDIEASHTTLTLFYDREDSDVVILKDKLCVGFLAIEHDRCALCCVTCDEDLGNRLLLMKKRFKELVLKVNEEHFDIRDDHKLNFIVSHPHGCFKMVSVGKWKELIRAGDRDDDVECKFTYTTCTCPGSSGATVHCVGHGWVNNLVHSGSLNPGLNHSGAAYFPM